MAVKFFDLFKNYMFVGLMIFSLLTFFIIVQSDNNATDPIVEDPILNNTYSDLETTLGGLRNQSQAQKELFEGENPTTGIGSILLFSILSAGKVFNGMIIAVFNTLLKFPVIILGFDPILISVLGALLIASIIFGLWAVYKLGG